MASCYLDLRLVLLLVFAFLRTSLADEYGKGGCNGNSRLCTTSTTHSRTTYFATYTSYTSVTYVSCGFWYLGRCARYRKSYYRRIMSQRGYYRSYSCRQCNIDCRVSSWSSWTCTGTCCAEIRHRRTRSVTVDKYGNGNSCPTLSDTKTTYDNSRACYIDNSCYRHNQLTSNGCKKCNKYVSRYNWELLSTISCNDGRSCTKNDQCINGNCRGTSYTCLTCQYCNGNGCPTRSGRCYIQGKCYRYQDRNPISKQCQMCDPYRGVSWKFYSLTSTTCDDGDRCTKGDRCSATGLCIGVPFTCLSDCQTCDGDNGCKTTRGCIASGVCGCNVAGRCYRHRATNPYNPCQHCDIYRNVNGWTNVPDGKYCNDRKSCTRSDRCRLGICKGVSFSCVNNQICVQSSTCNGVGCSIVYRPTTYRCYTRQDACDWPHQYCTGIATCPQNRLKPISTLRIAKGSVSVLRYGISVETELPYKAAESGNFYRMTTQNKGMRLKFSNFRVPCGTVTFYWKMVVEDEKRIQKSVVVLDTTTSDDSGTTVVSVSNLNLRHGGTYGIVVTARNIRGDSQVVLSDPILVDITPPWFFGSIRDGDAKDDIQYQYNATTMSAYWNPNQFIDRESGIDTASFKVGVGLWTSQGIRARSFTSSYANRAVLANLNLRHNTRYYMVVSVANRAGLTVEVASNGVLVDTTRPVTGKVTVQDAFGQTLDYQTICSRRIRATIANFKDDESGLILFQWRLCRRPHNISGSVSCSQRSYTSFNCSPSDRCSLDVYHGRDRMVQNGCFVHGYTYQLYIRVKNRAGLLSYPRTSNRFTVDVIPPTRGLVADGLGEDIDYQSDDQFLNASWTGFNDDVSGIHFYELTAFEKYGQPSKRVPVGSSRVFNTEQWRSSKLSLITGRNYYIKVVCYDKAGLFTETTSDGVMVDSLPPVAGEILDIDYPNFLEDIDYQISTSEIHTKWPAFQSASGIESCQWALSTSTDTINFGDVASERVLPQNESSYSLSIYLEPYIKYYASVRCTSKAGLVSATSFSDGVTPDPSPPLNGTVFDLCTDDCGSLNDTDCSANSTALAFRWNGFSDPESGIVEYEWNYAKCGNSSYIMEEFLSTNSTTSVIKTGVVLSYNESYSITVRAINSAGGKSDAVSNGILVRDDNCGPGNFFSCSSFSSNVANR